MKNTLIDNTENRMMADTLKECMANLDFKEIRIATGFWDLPGTKIVARELEKFLSREGTSMRLLIGTDPTVRSKYLDKDFPASAIKNDIFKLQFNEEYQPLIDLLFKYCKANPEESRLKIRIYKRDPEGEAQFLHSKCYVFSGGIDEAVGIIGSSNFTKMGLEHNAELNYLETDPVRVKYRPQPGSKLLGHEAWFDAMWEQSQDWNGEFINEVLSKAPIAKDNPNNPDNLPQALTPYEVYIKYLQTQFGDIIDESVASVLKSYLPEKYTSLEYQLDAVKQGISIMKRYGGFLLGDVVGLGKTVVGVLLIRMFLDQAESLGRPRKVLVVTPPAIRKGWVSTIEDFDKDSAIKISPLVDFITTGSIDKLVDDEDAGVQNEDGDYFDSDLDNTRYGLIVIDESHNFRNKGTQKYAALDDLIGHTNPTPYVALLSATPQNNSPQNLYNQISFFLRDANNCDLPGVEGGKLDSFFRAMINRYNEARNMPRDTPKQKAEAQKIIAEVSKRIREAVLNELVVRRTRADIKAQYPDDSAELRFPKIQGPHKLEYKMDEELAKLFYDTINAIHPDAANTPEAIQFVRYAAITQFRNPSHTKLYEKRNLTVDSITRRLQKIMQILLVKRLESSIVAFTASLQNLLNYTDVMIEMLRHDCVYIAPDLNVNAVYADCNGDFDKFNREMDAKIEKKGGNNRRFKASDFNASYLTDIEADRKIIRKLLDRWLHNSEDPKFERFSEAISELFNPAINNSSGQNKPKLVVFTEAIDTLKAVARKLKNKCHKVLEITAGTRNELADKIAENFDANYPKDKQRDEYDTIVTTEVLAEGVNLHRANVILNYDAPWNATRLMQRIGRVNRIGSVEEFVHVFNFFPSAEGNSQIRLIEKSYAKLQSFHEMFGEDSKIFSEEEELRDNQLAKIVDGDVSPFAQYILELKTYSQTSPERYEFIKGLPLDHLGGRINGSDCMSSLFIFTDQSQGLVSVNVDAQNDNEAVIISPLMTMEYMKCTLETEFVPFDFDDSNPMAVAALRKYQQHVTHALRGSDSSAKDKDAQEFLAELRNTPGVSQESKRLIANLNKLVRNKNRYVIKTLLKAKKDRATHGASLFGDDYDIFSWLDATFAHYATEAVKQKGESTLAFYEI